MNVTNTLKFLELLESNGDKIRSDTLPLCHYTEPNIHFEFSNTSCHICNGYYGPSFGEPVCLTCHAFLYPDYATFLPASVISSEKTDDGDSGNDEPSDLNYAAEKKNNQSQNNNVALWMLQNQGENDQEDEDSEERHEVFGGGAAGSSGLIPPNHPPQVEHRLEMLSNARPGDHIEPGLVQRLPPEVLLWIFGYLDDLSLCSVSMVCQQWRNLLKAHIPTHNWAKFINKRWPLYKSLLNNNDYFKTYQRLMTSCFCYTCLLQMAVQSQPVGEENSWRRNRLRTEIKVLRNDPPEGISAIPLDAKCCHWQATLTGPIGSPYEGGLFYLYIQIPYSYPMNPPVVRFLTKILHPNVSRHGDVGIDCIHHNWSLALTISKVLISIQSLLTDPYTNICMEPEIGHMYNTDRKTFEHLARQWTWKYAMHDVLIHQPAFK